MRGPLRSAVTASRRRSRELVWRRSLHLATGAVPVHCLEQAQTSSRPFLSLELSAVGRRMTGGTALLDPQGGWKPGPEHAIQVVRATPKQPMLPRPNDSTVESTIGDCQSHASAVVSEVPQHACTRGVRASGLAKLGGRTLLFDDLDDSAASPAATRCGTLPSSPPDARGRRLERWSRSGGPCTCSAASRAARLRRSAPRMSGRR